MRGTPRSRGIAALLPLLLPAAAGAACAGSNITGKCIKCGSGGGECKVIGNVNATSAEGCCAACSARSGCEFWVYNYGMPKCFLKAGDPSVQESGAKNILFIAIDDLRPEIGAYGHKYMHTPHMDALAEGGTLFQRAYVQYSFCGPSRNSFMTGRRPDRTKAWSFMDHFREPVAGPGWVSMPQYFRQQGYTVLAAGKLYHPGLPPSFDAPHSWDHYTHAGSCDGKTNGWPVLEAGVTNVACLPAIGCNAKGMVEGDGKHWCKMDLPRLCPECPPLEDDVVTNASIANLRAAKSAGRPFFVAVGFHKPHLPFYFPAEFDIYPPADQIAPPLHPLPPAGMPLVAWHEGNFDNKWGIPCNHTGEFRRAYYSAVSYTDSNVGKVLAALDDLGLAGATAVALMGDHGWQLGEMNEWRKMTNFELGVRVPLLFRVPWAQRAGARTPALAEAVDLYPTFVELAGLPPVPEAEGLQGRSLAGLISNPPGSGTGIREYAFSQFAKSNSSSSELKMKVPWNTCTKCNRSDILYMGYSVRSDDWRFTEWVGWNQTSWTPVWEQRAGRELYDHKGDFGEDFDRSTPTENVAFAEANAGVVAELLAVVREQFDNDRLPPSWVA